MKLILYVFENLIISENIDVGGSKYEAYGLMVSGSEHLLMGRKVHKLSFFIKLWFSVNFAIEIKYFFIYKDYI